MDEARWPGSLARMCAACGVTRGTPKTDMHHWEIGACDYCDRRGVAVTDAGDFGNPEFPVNSPGWKRLRQPANERLRDDSDSE